MMPSEIRFVVIDPRPRPISATAAPPCRQAVHIGAGRRDGLHGVGARADALPDRVPDLFDLAAQP